MGLSGVTGQFRVLPRDKLHVWRTTWVFGFFPLNICQIFCDNTRFSFYFISLFFQLLLLTLSFEIWYPQLLTIRLEDGRACQRSWPRSSSLNACVISLGRLFMPGWPAQACWLTFNNCWLKNGKSSQQQCDQAGDQNEEVPDGYT